VTLPIARRTVTLQLPGGKQSKVDTQYDATYGVVTDINQYDFGDGAPGSSVRDTSIAYTDLGNGISVLPYKVTVTSPGIVAQTVNTYDEGTPTGTTGTPHDAAGSGARGNLTTVTSYVTGNISTGGTTLTKHYTYYDTGNVKTATDVNNAITSYVYGACGNSLATEVDLPLTLKRFITWDSPACTGAVVKSVKDENNNTTSYWYGDSNYWRVTGVTDPLTNITTVSYPTINSTESSLLFNGNASVVDVRTTVDEFGRSHFVQRLQTPGGSTYESAETDYDAMGRVSKTTLLYSAAAGVACAGTCPGTSFNYDPLSRSTMVSDNGGGDISYDYTPGTSSNNNDVLVAVEPAPTGQNTKRRQLETDGLGRLSSVCEVTSGSGSGNCAQPFGQTGYWTKYTDDALGHIVGVNQSAQSTKPQGRSFTYDELGRTTSESNPESGTTTYTYDSATGCTSPFNGDLVKRVDAKGNTTCYQYDAMHRVTGITYSGPYSTAESTSSTMLPP